MPFEDPCFSTLRAAKDWCAECDVQLTRTGNFNRKKKRARKKGSKKGPDLVMKATERLIGLSDQWTTMGLGSYDVRCDLTSELGSASLHL